jgi:hypothetical protein
MVAKRLNRTHPGRDRQTYHLLSRLILNTVETGAITSGGAIVSMIMVLGFHKTNLHATL